jgi:hypothetical protein
VGAERVGVVEAAEPHEVVRRVGPRRHRAACVAEVEHGDPPRDQVPHDPDGRGDRRARSPLDERLPADPDALGQRERPRPRSRCDVGRGVDHEEQVDVRPVDGVADTQRHKPEAIAERTGDERPCHANHIAVKRHLGPGFVPEILQAVPIRGCSFDLITGPSAGGIAPCTQEDRVRTVPLA